MISIEYLESERVKIWEQIIELQESVKKKTSDFENDAKQASKKCSEYKNKCELAKNEAKTLLEEVQKATGVIDQANVSALIGDIQKVHDELIPKKENITSQIGELEKLFANYASYSEKLLKLTELSVSADDSSTKIDTIFKQVAARKKEVDAMYYEIFGYTQTDETTGVKTEVVGKKVDLEKAYVELKANFKQFEIAKDKEFTDTLNEWKTEYVNASKKIESLLPNALTAGLSHAYSSKKDAEIRENAELEKDFKKYVNGLIGISLIPFLISIYLLITGATLEDTILKMPRLVLSILPLYIPVLWVAYSANKKMNLSKRLIEEYTHKEVLSKTFEGLSKQIQNIEDSEISADLKTRLLYNILEVSSENPGKLISDYNKSDHPLMDALDKSVKLTNAIEHLAKIPGMSKLVSVLDTKAKEVLEKEAMKAVAGIEKVGK
jgi:hypothetical protein